MCEELRARHDLQRHKSDFSRYYHLPTDFLSMVKTENCSFLISHCGI